MTDPQTRRRWINVGEIIGVAALIISALGLWLTWKSSSNDQPTRVVEQKQPIPLILRGSAEHDGRELAISPVESGHALESLSVTVPSHQPVEVGSDGRLSANAVEAVLASDKERKGSGRAAVKISARYVEMGKERRATGTYTLRYHWEGGGLFGGHSLRLDGLSR